MTTAEKGKCILHIGITKTGSTSIQEFLFRHLNDERFLYAHFDRRNSGKSLLHAFDWESSAIDKYQARDLGEEGLLEKRDDCRRMLTEQIETARGKTVIISGEALSFFHPEKLENFIDFLKPHFDRIEAVAYVRHPKSHMESAFQQRMKNVSTRKLRVRDYSPKFKNIFEKFQHLLGRENVHVWRFDRASFPEGDVVLDFCDRLGIDPPAERVSGQNQSLSREAIALFFTYRHYFPKPRKGKRARSESFFLRSELMELEGDGLRFHPDYVKPVIEANRHHVDWLDEQFGIDLHQDFGTMPRTGIRSKRDIMTYSDETLDWLARKLDGPGYLKVHPFEWRRLPAIVANCFTRRRRLAIRRNVAADVNRLMDQAPDKRMRKRDIGKV